jgi:cysteinyl-tRNA synthetase
MGEFPEKKVLKDLLTKLKSHTIASAEELRKEEERFAKRFEESHERLRTLAKRCETTPNLTDAVDAFAEVIRLMDLLAEDFAKSVHRNDENVKFYIEALEEYSTELDGTLTDIFERARKEAEEQIRNQEELRKRTSPESYTA